MMYSEGFNSSVWPFRTNLIVGRFEKSSQRTSSFDKISFISGVGPAIRDVPVSIATPQWSVYCKMKSQTFND